MRVLSADRAQQPLHRVLLFLNGGDQRELGAAAVEVVAFTMNLEIGVAVEVIGEEADAGFKGDELAGGDERILFSAGEERTGGVEVAAGDGLKEWKMHEHLGEIAL